MSTTNQKSTSPYGNLKPAPMISVQSNYAEIFNVIPPTIDASKPIGLAGFLLVCTGKKIEFPFPNAVYKRNTHVFQNSHVFRRVFDFKIDGLKVEGNNSYPKKALLWICPPGTTFTKEDCKYLMDEYFNLCKDVGTILEEIVPSFDPSTGYHEADHWEKHLSIEDMNHICEWSYLKDAFGTLTSFFKSSRNNLYSYIKPGIASTKFFQTFDINDEKQVLPEDIVNLACDPIVTPTSTPVRKTLLRLMWSRMSLRARYVLSLPLVFLSFLNTYKLITMFEPIPPTS
jgi:hypothetical protein